jgi:hypothetical protein
VLIHWTLSMLAPRSLRIEGIATFTMLRSSTDMNMPVISTASGRPHPVAGGVGGGGGAGGLLAGGTGRPPSRRSFAGASPRTSSSSSDLVMNVPLETRR